MACIAKNERSFCLIMASKLWPCCQCIIEHRPNEVYICLFRDESPFPCFYVMEFTKICFNIRGELICKMVYTAREKFFLPMRIIFIETALVQKIYELCFRDGIAKDIEAA